MGSDTRQDFTELIEQILYKKTGYGKFKVFDYEASSGKTYTYSKCVAEYYHLPEAELCIGNVKENYCKSLIVIKTMHEGAIVANNINISESKLKDVQRPFDTFAEAVNTEYKQSHPDLTRMNEAEYIKYIRKIPVLIITQKEYLNICADPQRGQNYYGNRELLIIDEEIDIVYNSFAVLTMTDISIIYDKYLNGCSIAQSIFNSIVKPIKPHLLDNILQMKRVEINIDVAELNKQIQAFHFQLNQAIDDRKYQYLKANYKEFEQTQNADEAKMVLMNKVRNIEKFYNNHSVIKYGSYLHTYNQNYKLFTLENNIWIDASASFNSIYTIAYDTFKLASRSKRTIDHSESKIIFDVVTKSTTSGKAKYIDLEVDILKYISENSVDGDKVLVMDNKDECDRIFSLVNDNENKKFSKLKEMQLNKCFFAVNYQAMRGSNDWGDYNKVYLIQQPQFLLVYYVFLYEYWAQCKLSSREMYLSNHMDESIGESVFGFYLPHNVNGESIEYTEDENRKNVELEQLRYTTQASSIYQGIKRIQRNQKPRGEYIVLLKDKRMRDIVVSQLRNVNIEYKDFKIRPKIDTPENDVAKLRNKIFEMEVGTIADIDKIAGEFYTSRDYINTIIKRNPSLQEVMQNRLISITWLMEASWYLLGCEEGFQISFKEFEEKFHVKWDSKYRRSRDLDIVKSKRHITAKRGIITVGETKY